MKKTKNKVYVLQLLKRCPEKETAYDKLLDKEYWMFLWSDDRIGEGTLYKSQIERIKERW